MQVLRTRTTGREDLSYSAPVSSPEEPKASGSPMGQSEADIAAEDAEILAEAKSLKRGQGHTYLYLIAVCIGLMAVSPILNRYLETFQGVVVTIPAEGSVEILQHEGFLIERRVSDDYRAQLSVGTYLRKVPAQWNPQIIELDGLEARTDIEDPRLQPRVFLPSRMQLYLDSWSGSVYAIRNQQLPTTGHGMGEVGERTTLELQLDDGGTKSLLLNDELRAALLGKVGVGLRLGKRARQWGPVVLPPGEAAPPPRPEPSAPPPPAPEAGSPVDPAGP